jgi:GT2 family glycosyltransferase
MDGEADPPLAERLGRLSVKADPSTVPGVWGLSYDQPMPETIRAEADDLGRDGSIAVVVLTHNRAHLLRKCVENVLLRTSAATREIVIWDNASTDDTAAYLDSLTDSRLRVLHSPENVGQNGYARAFKLTSSDYLIEVDDDVVDAPRHWDVRLRDALRRLPTIGFLSADLEDDPHDVASQHRHHLRVDEYTVVDVNGIRVLRGPTGGGCAITSRELYDRVGGFKERKNEVFFLEDAAYIKEINALGYEAAALADLRVHHTGGPYYSQSSPEKDAYWARWDRQRARKAAVKRLLYRLPFVGRLNGRFGWFEPPAAA